MSTRGFIGFVVDGAEKIGYNHSDSYPSGLGIDMLTWLRTASVAELAERTKALRVVESEAEPTDEEIERFRGSYDPSVGGPSDRPTWYQLLRKTQGDPAAILRAGAIEDASGFPGNSLFAEWGYVVDMDTRTFEAYVGFQAEPHDKGRFASRPRRELSVGTYYPVALAASWPLDNLPGDEEFVAALESAENDEVTAR